MSEKSGTGEGRGGFLREDLEEGREGESGRGGFLSLFRAINCGGAGGRGYALLPREFFFMKIWKSLRDFHEEEEDYT